MKLKEYEDNLVNKFRSNVVDDYRKNSYYWDNFNVKPVKSTYPGNGQRDLLSHDQGTRKTLTKSVKWKDGYHSQLIPKTSDYKHMNDKIINNYVHNNQIVNDYDLHSNSNLILLNKKRRN